MGRKRTGYQGLISWPHCVLKILVVSASLSTLCDSQNSNYFSNPWIEFGSFIRVSFSEGSLDLLYECLCDVNIIHCSITYELADGLNERFGLPYYYKVTNFVQNRTTARQSNGQLYSSSVLCEHLQHRETDKLNCQRLAVNDRTCETKNQHCLVYSVDQDPTNCSSDCASLVWLADFTFGIEYHNFGSRALPVKDGVCSMNDDLSTLPYIFDTPDAVSVKIQSSKKEKNSQTFSFGILRYVLYTGIGALCLVLLVIFVSFVSRNIKRRQIKSSLQPPVSLNNIQQGSTSAGTVEINSIESEETGYNTIDEMAATVEQETEFTECDDQGYIIIQNGTTQSWDHGLSRDETRSCRPLPETPVSGGTVSDTTDTSGTTNPQLSPLLSTSSTLAPSDAKLRQDLRSLKEKILTRQHPKTREPPRPHRRLLFDSLVPVRPLRHPIPDDTQLLGNLWTRTNRQETLIPDSSTTKERPQPHKRLPDSQILVQMPPSNSVSRVSTKQPLNLSSAKQETFSCEIQRRHRPHQRSVDIDDHQYLCRVNLRQDKTIFGDTTEVKLIRTQHGHLELVDVQDELPAFTEYYTRILLINQDNNSVGVVGLLGESHSNDNEELSTNSCAKETEEHFLENTICFIGSLDIEEDTRFEPCDYLTLQDTEHSIYLVAV